MVDTSAPPVQVPSDGNMIMSDAISEIRDLDGFRGRAAGDVLINSLGLGIVVQRR